MKKVVTVFPRDKYHCIAGAAGAQTTLMEEKLMAMIGSADALRVEITTYSCSGSTVRIAVSLFEGAKAEVRPSMNVFSGIALVDVPASPAAPVAGVVETQVSSPFAGILDMVLKVWDTTGTPIAGWVEAEVRVTLFFN